MSSRAQRSRRALLPVGIRRVKVLPCPGTRGGVAYLSAGFGAVAQQGCRRAGEEGEKFSQETVSWDLRMAWGWQTGRGVFPCAFQANAKSTSPLMHWHKNLD